LPPSVGSPRIFPRSHTSPRQMGPVLVGKNAEQLHSSPSGSRSAVSATPEIKPRLFLTGQRTALFGPPSVPRSIWKNPNSQSDARMIWSPARLDWPDTQNRLLMLLPALAPPSVGSLITWYRDGSPWSFVAPAAAAGAPSLEPAQAAAPHARAATTDADHSLCMDLSFSPSRGRRHPTGSRASSRGRRIRSISSAPPTPRVPDSVTRCQRAAISAAKGTRHTRATVATPPRARRAPAPTAAPRPPPRRAAGRRPRPGTRRARRAR